MFSKPIHQPDVNDAWRVFGAQLASTYVVKEDDSEPCFPDEDVFIMNISKAYLNTPSNPDLPIITVRAEEDMMGAAWNGLLAPWHF